MTARAQLVADGLAGPAVELGLKAVPARRFVTDEIPALKLVRAFYTHRLADLLALAELRDPRLKGRDELQANGTVISTWTKQTR